MSLAIVSVIGVVLSLLFYIFCLNHVEYQHVGIALNSNSGEVVVQNKPGWYVTSPFVRVKEIDTNTIRVSLIECLPIHDYKFKIAAVKVVRIKEDKIMDFVNFHGFNNLPMNLDSQSFRNIICAYAFCGEQFDWLEIVEAPTNIKN